MQTKTEAEPAKPSKVKDDYDDYDEPISEKAMIEKYWRTSEPDLYELREMERKKEAEEAKQPHILIRSIKWTYETTIWLVSGIWQIILEPSKGVELCKHCWKVIVHEFHHYKDGTILLYNDIKTSYMLFLKVAMGQELSRRQKRLMVRTTADAMRLIPFSVFVIVPGLEFFLPICLRIFPNMLPSQYVESHKKEEAIRTDMIARLNLAEFLQETVKDMATKHIKGGKGETEDQARNLINLLEKVRNGEHVTNAQLRAVATLFRDDITLDNMDRPNLALMCKFLAISPYAPSEALLRTRLRQHIDAIRRDDEAIQDEGIESLTLQELRQACRERGMKAASLTEAGYRKNLKQWLDLSLKEKIPITLLILSRTFALTERRPRAVKNITLKQTIKALEPEVVEELKVDAGVADNRDRLEVISRQRELVAEEAKDEAAKGTEKKPEQSTKESLDKTKELDEKLKQLANKLTTMSSKSPVAEERERLEQLKKTIASQKRMQLKEKLEYLEKQLAGAPLQTSASSATPAPPPSAPPEPEIAAKEKDTAPEPTTLEPEASNDLAEEGKVPEVPPEAKEKVVPQPSAEAPTAEPTVASRAVQEEVEAQAARQQQADKEKAEKEKLEKEKIEKEKEEREKAEKEKAEKEKAEKEKVEKEKAEKAKAEKEKADRERADKEKAQKEAQAEKLSSRVDQMIQKLNVEISDVEKSIGSRLNLLDLDHDGQLSTAELENAIKVHFNVFTTDEETKEAVQQLKKLGEHTGKAFISVEDLKGIVQNIREKGAKQKEKKEEKKEGKKKGKREKGKKEGTEGESDSEENDEEEEEEEEDIIPERVLVEKHIDPQK